jgi:hypothetical protein
MFNLHARHQPDFNMNKKHIISTKIVAYFHSTKKKRAIARETETYRNNQVELLPRARSNAFPRCPNTSRAAAIIIW